MLSIRPKLAEFTHANVPMAELASFYTTAPLEIPTHRPYVWSNSMTSLDGFMHFKSTRSQLAAHPVVPVAKSEHEHGSVESDIALKRHPLAGPFSLADYRLLNAGWVFADAVLSSGPCVRTDPLLRHVPIFGDMIKYRTEVLHKPKCPFQILVSTTAATFDYTSHAMFNSSDLPVIVVSLEPDSKTAQAAFLASRENLPSPASSSRLWNPESDATYTPGTVRFVSFAPSTRDPRGVDLEKLLEWLRVELKVDFLEIDAGGSMIRRMIDFKLIDEVRLTQVGQVILAFKPLTTQERWRIAVSWTKAKQGLRDVSLEAGAVGLDMARGKRDDESVFLAVAASLFALQNKVYEAEVVPFLGLLGDSLRSALVFHFNTSAWGGGLCEGDANSQNKPFLKESKVLNETAFASLFTAITNKIKLFTATDATLLFRASEVEFDEPHFHAACDGKPNTITLLKFKSGRVAGAYVNAAWETVPAYKGHCLPVDEAFRFAADSKGSHLLRAVAPCLEITTWL
ncbi:hypothetical protein HDU98_009541 [Podochytrium sp. JEL0797]|nr:hypothetical protein HDU98_009541 [Podochytrium sp. JEL0797]